MEDIDEYTPDDTYHRCLQWKSILLSSKWIPLHLSQPQWVKRPHLQQYIYIQGIGWVYPKNATNMWKPYAEYYYVRVHGAAREDKQAPLLDPW